MSQQKKHFLWKVHLDKTTLSRNNWEKWCSKSVRVIIIKWYIFKFGEQSLQGKNLVNFSRASVMYLLVMSKCHHNWLFLFHLAKQLYILEIFFTSDSNMLKVPYMLIDLPSVRRMYNVFNSSNCIYFFFQRTTGCPHQLELVCHIRKNA